MLIPLPSPVWYFAASTACSNGPTTFWSSAPSTATKELSPLTLPETRLPFATRAEVRTASSRIGSDHCKLPDCQDSLTKHKLRLNSQGWEPWSSDYGKRLMSWRSWVRILAPYTGWTFFTLICCKIVLIFVWKRPKRNKKLAGDRPFKKNYLSAAISFESS